MRIALAAQGFASSDAPVGFRSVYALEATPNMYTHSADLFLQMRTAGDRLDGYYVLPAETAKTLIAEEVENLTENLSNKSILFYALRDFHEALDSVRNGFVVI